MRSLLFMLMCVVSFTMFSQEEEKNDEEFLPIVIEDKEAFMSTKTGEYVFRAHDETDANFLKTTDSGVVYTDIFYHTVKKKESLFKIAKKNGVTVDEIKKWNKLKNANLDIDQKLKIVKKHIVKSSSPVITYAGEERIVARLRPNQNPWEMNSPPPGTQPASAPITATETDRKTHTVKSGETLFSLSKKYNISIEELKSLNNLTLNTLSVGQKLKVK